MPFNKKVTVIQLSPETRDKLKALGKKGETYEDVILRLIKKQKKN
ncbi:antitoxin VapB family protein [Candidatus Micrarchaeota archaeon]|nr:antitoxin VapB family protein [Candidatus Micrarchaeota archaeon]